MTTLTHADLQSLGYRVVDGKAVKETATTKAIPPRSLYRSKWEAERADFHERRKRWRLIRDWRYEPIRLKLANGAWYKIDFMIVHNDGYIELEEVKGHWREAARVRYKVAVSQYPMFAFTVVTKRGGSWHVVEERCGGWLDIVSSDRANG